MAKRYRFYAELDKDTHDKLAVLGRGIRKDVFNGLLRAFIEASPKREDGKVDLRYSFSVAQNDYELVKKEEEGVNNNG